MKELRIIDIIGSPNAILHSFGMKVFEALKNPIQQQEQVILSFEGLKGLTTAFCHAAIGNLYEVFGNDTANYLTLKDLKPSWENKIQEAKDLALDAEKKAYHEKLIDELFD